MGRLLDPYLPFLWVGRLMHPWWRLRFARFGAESLLYRPAWLDRPDLMEIGERVWISPRAWFEVRPPSSENDEVAIRIGDGVVMRHHVGISACVGVTIEDDVLISAGVRFYDSDHTLGERGNSIWYPQRLTPIRVGRGSWLAERVIVLRGADIGHHCIIGAHSVVKGTIPDYSVAVGAPARVVGSTREMIEENGGGERLTKPAAR
jgi:acetyltransferase-like isoleucine patch superfamily enzyme